VDHGDVVLDNGDRLRLYGTPGQRRFEPTWRALADGAMRSRKFSR
jgi:signal recognition particle receptor subunit beta